MKGILPSSYQELIQLAGNYSHLPKPSAEYLLNSFGMKGLKLHADAPIFFVIDYTEEKYLYIDPSCKEMFGYEQQILYKEGPLYWTANWHEKDFKVFSESIVKEIVAFLKTVKPDESSLYSISYNYRLKAPGDNYITVLQRSTYYISDDHIPLASVGYALDITHFKEDNTVILTIEKVEPFLSRIVKVPVHKSVYYPENNNEGLTKREVEILQLIYEGYSSKEICSRLYISKYTVDNHRKKLLEKLKAKNSSELIYLAKKKGIL